MQWLQTYPLRTKLITAGIILPASDITAQTIER